jgi:hypothetical protein
MAAHRWNSAITFAGGWPRQANLFRPSRIAATHFAGLGGFLILIPIDRHRDALATPFPSASGNLSRRSSRAHPPAALGYALVAGSRLLVDALSQLSSASVLVIGATTPVK